MFSFEPLSTRGPPVTQKLSQERKVLRTWDQRQSIILEQKKYIKKLRKMLFQNLVVVKGLKSIMLLQNEN